MIKRLKSPNPKKALVRFELPPAVWAEEVSLVGEFNNWSETAHSMKRDQDDGAWYVVVELEPGREYQFRYLVNGREWHNDWSADRYVPNPYGGTNSVVVIA
jgi:1,4-alpha-glucan branching enzyme